MTSQVLPYQRPKDNSTLQILDITSSVESKATASQNKLPISVIPTRNTSKIRIYDKRFKCTYCSKSVAKLARHFQIVHANERDVINYMEEKNTSKKNAMLKKLKNLGNHMHNVEVIRNNSGQMMVTYRPKDKMDGNDYLPCEYCLGYFAKNSLWLHVKRCSLAPESRKKHARVLASSRLLLPSNNTQVKGFDKVLNNMMADDTARVAKSDALILKVGEKLYLRQGHDSELHSNIRGAMRELSRRLRCLREMKNLPNAKLEDFIDPIMFKDVVCAARKESGYSEITHTFGTPSLALKLGHSIKKCAKIMKGNALQTGDESLEKKANAFWELCELNWTEEVSTHALRTICENKRNRVMLIPLTNDVVLLNKYISEIGEAAFARLNVKPDDKGAWASLAEAALVQMILFNRRRQGEVSKMTLEDYKKKHITAQDDITETLAPFENKLCQTLERIEIIGKRGRTVPVILTSQCQRYLEKLIEARSNVEVAENNLFFFARVNFGSVGHIRGCDCLRDFSMRCGAKTPELLRSTKLRKQIATLSQILNLQDHEQDALANFLGHDIRVHREFYRLPEGTIQVAKISKLLLAMENGTFIQHAGKGLDSITVAENEEAVVENESDEEPDTQHHDEHDMADLPIKKKRKQEAKKRLWSEEEKSVVIRYFEKNIHMKRLPGKLEIMNCLKSEDVLRNRNWKNVKDFVRNKMLSSHNIKKFTK